MAVSEAPETPVSRKRMRFTVPPADIYSGSRGYGSEDEIQEHSESDGGNEERQDEENEQGQEESQNDQETSESDVDDEGLDEEGEQVEQERQIDQELSESDTHPECRQDEKDEQVEEERQMDQESSESEDEEEEQGEEDNQVEQERQMDQGSSESDGEDEEQNEVDEQVEQEMQMDQESSESDSEDEEQDEVDEQESQIEEHSESDGEDEEQNIEEELAEGESQSIQAPVESTGNDEDEEDEQEMHIDQARSQSGSEDVEQYVEEPLREEESQNNQASVDAAGGDEEEEDEQVEDVSGRGRVQKSSSEPALAPPLSKPTAMTNMTLDEDMLDCGVCCLPLKPPIFQCDVGHVICSSCRDKLAVVGRCHVCRTSVTGGYRRCHALEQLVEPIRVSCPNAIYGCTARVPYYNQQAHLQACPRAPCHCPAEGCGFVGSTLALVDHFVGTHKWPCVTGVKNSETRVAHLHYSFNIMAVVHDARVYLFLLRVVRSPFGRAISCVCLHPQAPADDSSPLPSEDVSCRLQLFYMRGVLKDSGMLSHLQDSNFKVACTDLSNGMPGLRDCFQFIVPYAVQPETEATVKVEVSFTIR